MDVKSTWIIGQYSPFLPKLLKKGIDRSFI